MTSEPIHDDDAELALLRCCFLEQGEINAVSDLVSEGDWFVPAHRLIWQAMVVINKDGADVDAPRLHEELTRIGRWSVAGGAAYLYDLLGTPPLKNIRACAERVVDLARRRALQLKCEITRSRANDPHATREEVAAAVESLRAGWECGGNELPSLTAAEIDRLEWPDVAEWLIAGWWGHEACGFLAAFEKSSKTILALGMALCVATGTKWLRRWDVQRGPVVFVAEEDHKRRVQRRIRMVGRALGLDWRTNDLHISAQEGCQLQTERGRGKLAAAVRHFHPILTVIDPLRRVIPGINENDSEEMSGILGWCRRLQVEEHTAVMILDHMRKPGQMAGGDAARASHRIRGTGDKGAWWDSFIEIRRKAQDDPEHKVRAEHRDASPLSEQIVRIVWDDDAHDLRINLGEPPALPAPAHERTEPRGTQQEAF
jgi:hypothetical protein